MWGFARAGNRQQWVVTKSKIRWQFNLSSRKWFVGF
jgi:hypothetical protein